MSDTGFWIRTGTMFIRSVNAANFDYMAFGLFHSIRWFRQLLA